MKQYTYNGPLSGVTLKDESGKETEYLFHAGEVYSLPSKHDYVISMVAQGYLTEAVAAVEPAPVVEVAAPVAAKDEAKTETKGGK